MSIVCIFTVEIKIERDTKMDNTNTYHGGENFSLSDILIQTRRKTLKERTEFFSDYINEELKTTGCFI
jgi:hypothetical protein